MKGRPDEPLVLDGYAIEHALRPRDGEDLGEMLRARSAAGAPVAIRGGGSRSATGNPLAPVDTVLDLGRLAAVVEFDADDGVVLALAGTPLSALRAAVEDAAGERGEPGFSGWELPLDPPGASPTLGGTLASAAPGPRFPRPRDAVLGLGVVLASGARTRCGGRVVKNVTGYDLAKLHTGAFGGFGVIESAWLRLRPRPQRVRTLELEHAWDDAGAGRALRIARGDGVRACAALGPMLRVELAGDDATVEAAARELGDARAGTGDGWDPVRGFCDPSQVADDTLLLRLAVLPTRVGAAARMLRDAGGEVLAFPGQGLIFARFPWDGASAAALSAGEAAAHAGGGALRLEAAPLALRRARDVFGDPGATLPLLRALKDQFDPGRLLNPGRLPGRL